MRVNPSPGTPSNYFPLRLDVISLYNSSWILLVNFDVLRFSVAFRRFLYVLRFFVKFWGLSRIFGYLRFFVAISLFVQVCAFGTYSDILFVFHIVVYFCSGLYVYVFCIF